MLQSSSIKRSVCDKRKPTGKGGRLKAAPNGKREIGWGVAECVGGQTAEFGVFVL